jgi:cation diffusion facilitator CzcD-associated flavoprotein CzcO
LYRLKPENALNYFMETQEYDVLVIGAGAAGLVGAF